MRVGILTYGLHRGGRSRMLCQLANGLAARGHEVTIVMLSGQPTAYPVRVPIEYVTELNERSLPRMDVMIPASFGLVPVALRSGHRVARFCAQFEPDHVYDYRGALQSYLQPVPTIAVSQPLAERIRQLSGATCYVANPGVDPRVFAPDPVLRVEGGRRICYVYRPDALGYGYKANDDFWQAVAVVRQHEPELEIAVVAPDGLPVVSRVHHEVARAETDDELADFYRRGNVFVSASGADSYNLATLEAMACGTPAVLADSGSVRDYAVPGVNCFMGVAGNVAMLTDLILAALRRPDLSSAFAAGGVATARTRTWDRFADQADQALRRVIGQGQD